MFIHEIQSKNTASKKRVGRGGKRGKTSGRGHKGQKQHGSHGIRPALRDIIKTLPKLRGYRFGGIQEKPLVINLAVLENAFSGGDTVTPTTLSEKGIISKRESAVRDIKILGDGEITKKLTIEGCTTSSSAKAAIEKAGGVVV
jgi:large subunit ribosomal protein L15